MIILTISVALILFIILTYVILQWGHEKKLLYPEDVGFIILSLLFGAALIFIIVLEKY